MADGAGARYLDGAMAAKNDQTAGGRGTAAKKATARAPRGARKAAAPALPHIHDPAQRALARQVPRLCAVFGYPVDSLTVRGRSETPDEYVRNGFRQLALGSVAWLGRELGIPWTGLHAYGGEGGKTEVVALRGAQRFSLFLFAARFGALTGLGDDPGTGRQADPVGEVGAFVRQAYELIRADAMRDLGGSTRTEAA